MTDIVERLNAWSEDRVEARTWGGPTMYGPALAEDEVKQAAAEITRLREALTAIRDIEPDCERDAEDVAREAIEIATDALMADASKL